MLAAHLCNQQIGKTDAEWRQHQALASIQLNRQLEPHAPHVDNLQFAVLAQLADQLPNELADEDTLEIISQRS